MTEPNNTIRNADRNTFRRLTFKPIRVRDRVSRNDLDDFYRLQLDTRSSLDIEISRLRANADLELYNRRGRRITQSSRNRRRDESINRTLRGGVYYLRVFPNRPNQGTQYKLTVTPEGDTRAMTEPNNSIQQADRGTFRRPRRRPTRVRDLVDRNDSDDFYRMRIRSRTSLDITLDRLRADADLELLNEQGRRVARSSRNRRRDDTINRTVDAGIYYLRVFQARRNQSTRYRLTVTGNNETAGNNQEDALDIGELTAERQVLTDYVAKSDRRDVFQFTVDEPSELKAIVTNLKSPIRFQIRDEDFRRVFGTNTNDGERRTDRFQGDLDPGTYYFQVVRKGRNSSTLYKIRTSAGPIVVRPDNAGDTLATATAYTLGGTASDPLGVDDTDIYTFTTGGLETDANFNLAGQGDATLELLNSAGNRLFISNTAGTSTEAITAAGLTPNTTYYVRITHSNAGAYLRSNLTLTSSFTEIAVDNVDDTFAEATPYTLETSAADPLGRGDVDIYSFTSDSIPRLLDLNLSGEGDASLELIDANQITVLASSTNPGTSAESITGFQMDPNTLYYVRISKTDSNSLISSELTLTSTLNPLPDGVGNDAATATPVSISANGTTAIANGTEPLEVNDIDVYSFVAPSVPSSISLTLSGLTANADIELLDQNQSVVESSSNAGTADDVISNVALTEGETYYIRVSKPTASDFTFYTLTSNTVVNVSDIDNGQDGSTPFVINWQQQANGKYGIGAADTGYQNTDFLGSFDGADFYQFELASDSFIDVEVAVSQGNADVQLLTSVGGAAIPNTVSARAGTATELVEGVFNAGTYFIKVTPGTGGDDLTIYDLDLQATSTALIPAFVRDINPGVGNSGVDSSVANLGGVLYFAARDANGVGLWSSDGTLETTTLVQRFSSIGDLFAAGSNIYFSADIGAGFGSELWISDGSAAGTRQLADINTGAPSSGIQDFIAVGDKIYFIADDSPVGETNDELWVIDTTQVNVPGSTTVVTKVPEIAIPFETETDPVSSDHDNLTAFGNTLYFTARDAATGLNDDTFYRLNAQGAPELLTTGGFDFSNIGDLTVFNNDLYFSASTAATGIELFKFNGTAFSLVSDINNTASSNPTNLTVAGNDLYFVADDGTTGRELWRFNGTNSTLVANIGDGLANNEPEDDGFVSELTAVGDTLYFRADDGNIGDELWFINNGNAELVADINQTADEVGSNPSNFTLSNGNLYFTADDGLNGNELWRIQPGEEPELLDLNTGIDNGLPLDSDPSDLVDISGRLFFRAGSEEVGSELWVVGVQQEP